MISRTKTKYNAEELKLIKQYFAEGKSDDYIATQLGRTELAIKFRRRKMKLKKRGYSKRAATQEIVKDAKKRVIKFKGELVINSNDAEAPRRVAASLYNVTTLVSYRGEKVEIKEFTTSYVDTVSFVEGE